MGAVASVLLGILVLLLVFLIAQQRREIRELMGLNAGLAQQAKDLAGHLETLDELEKRNVALLSLLAEEPCVEIEDSAKQSTESQPKSNNK